MAVRWGACFFSGFKVLRRVVITVGCSYFPHLVHLLVPAGGQRIQLVQKHEAAAQRLSVGVGWLVSVGFGWLVGWVWLVGWLVGWLVSVGVA